MAQSSEIKAHERLSLSGRPAKRGTPQEFLESFDARAVPAQPGCYLMLDEAGRVVYAGKAKNLRARIRSYLNESDSRYSVRFLMQRVAHIDFLVTSNEKEALLLENSLIKQHKPRYNVQLKDDKTYVSLRFNLNDEFPRITVTRRPRNDGAKYFGPYDSARAVRQTLRGIHRLFPLRTCSDGVMRNRTRPCLYYQMGQCAAPCVGHILSSRYHELAQQAVMVLEGRSRELEKRLLEQIDEHAARLEFEQAAEIRDRLFALRRTLERQRTVGAPGAGDRDVFGYYVHNRFVELQVLHYRGGKLMDGRAWSFKQCEMPIEELLSSFLLQYYSESTFVPPEILAPAPLEDAEPLEQILSEARGFKVKVHWPQRGDKNAQVDLAMRNAAMSFEQKRLAEQSNADLLEQIRLRLKLDVLPVRIECFDIATTQGCEPVGAMVVFENGVPAKNRYRRYRIKSVEGQDDFAMMREMLMRRYQRAVAENDLPSLVVIDGGKGQLNVALAVFKDLGIEDLAAVGLAKARPGQAGGHSPERFYLPGQMNPVTPPQHSPVVRFMARVRDETHRFVNSYHRKRRGKAMMRTPLVDIPGIGKKRARVLLNGLGSVNRVRGASVEEIAALPGFNKALAQTVKNHLAAVPPGLSAGKAAGGRAAQS